MRVDSERVDHARTDWASWGTAIGTLVLAVATFASVRSGNRAGRNAERSYPGRDCARSSSHPGRMKPCRR